VRGDVTQTARQAVRTTVDGVGGTQLAGDAESRVVDIDGHDGGRAGYRGRHHGGEADAASAEYGQGRADRDRERVEHRPGARLDAAAERSG
jgi:hypothetical protein